jgi:HAE1 family hydrophobic/amphiphilic exporter-1
MGGMCVATLLSLFIVPILYIVVKNIEERMKTDLYRPKFDREFDGDLEHEQELEAAIAPAFHGNKLNGDKSNVDGID